MKNFVETLVAAGWNCTPCSEERPVTHARLLKAPADFRTFISAFDMLSNAEDTAWFLSLKDYETGNPDDAFAWNEFERESLEYAEDEAERDEVSAFWENTLPIAMSVKEQRAYLGLLLDEENYGKIVYGCEPIYEEAEIVCDTFGELLKLFAGYVSGESPEEAVFGEFA